MWTVAVIIITYNCDKTPIEEGDYFIAIISDDYDSYSPLVKLTLNTESKTIELSEIVLEKSYNTKICNDGLLPIIFRYMGNDEVFELITERKIPIMYDEDEFNEFNIFENSNEYKKIINTLVAFYPKHIGLLKVSDKLKFEYYALVQEHDIELKQELDKHFEKARDNFDKSYQEIIEECIYPLAAVDNMMFNLDKKLENEDKNKVKLKK